MCCRQSKRFHLVLYLDFGQGMLLNCLGLRKEYETNKYFLPGVHMDVEWVGWYQSIMHQKANMWVDRFSQLQDCYWTIHLECLMVVSSQESVHHLSWGYLIFQWLDRLIRKENNLEIQWVSYQQMTCVMERDQVEQLKRSVFQMGCNYQGMVQNLVQQMGSLSGQRMDCMSERRMELRYLWTKVSIDINMKGKSNWLHSYLQGTEQETGQLEYISSI